MAILPPARRGAMYATKRSVTLPRALDSSELERPPKEFVSPIQGGRWTGNAESAHYTAQPGVYGKDWSLAQASAQVTKQADTGRYHFQAEYYPGFSDEVSSAQGSFTTRTPKRARIASQALVNRLAHHSNGRIV